ncbi:Transglutaminase-like superfamily protein [Ruminococcaceae bacterium YRB3002]|nr:Transglutaminase-like superfamily protein [Ruminococcaceae bacterium YRB3002]
MLVRKLAAVILTGAVLFNITAAVNADTGAGIRFKNSVDISHCDVADYDQITMVDHKGNPIVISVSGGSIRFTSDEASSVVLNMRNCSRNKSVASKNTMDHSFVFDAADKMEIDDVYYLDLKFRSSDTMIKTDSIYIRKDDTGTLRMVKSPVYDFNLERCKEMWTDADSLQECLEPQNDIESDDPYVISVSNKICEGLDNDWDKAFAIYSYIVENFAYDDVQIDDEHYAYQDDAVSLLRRKVSICEGFSNVFVALCRAQGIPSVVEFGVTYSFAEFTSISSNREEEWPNHAWAAVFLDGEWRFVDPTFDNHNHFEGDDHESGTIRKGSAEYNYFCLPLEMFSMEHKICDADTYHSIESSGSCGDSASYRITRDGTLTISGSGEISLPEGVNGFRRVVFEEGSNITSIGNRCFIDCDLLTEVILPDTVTRIEDEAFNTCEDLHYIYLPEGLTYIGQEAFDICDELTYVYVPDSVTTIGKYAFDDCPRLILSVPKSQRNVGEYDYVPPYRLIVRDK